MLKEGLVLKVAGKAGELDALLLPLATKLEGFQLALEYISDYVKISGMRLWQTEFARVVHFFAEQVWPYFNTEV